MNNNRHNLLHYVLVILLMFAPLRSVMADHCNMADMDFSSGNASLSNTVMKSTAMQVHDMSAMLSTDSMASEMNAHGCCDDISVNCSASCELGVNASLATQEISYKPVYKDSFKSVSLSSKTLFRELTPPSRPPLKLS